FAQWPARDRQRARADTGTGRSSAAVPRRRLAAGAGRRGLGIRAYRQTARRGGGSRSLPPGRVRPRRQGGMAAIPGTGRVFASSVAVLDPGTGVPNLTLELIFAVAVFRVVFARQLGVAAMPLSRKLGAEFIV